MRNVGYAQNEARRNMRIKHQPLRLMIGGKIYNAVDWSYGGFQIARKDFDLSFACNDVSHVVPWGQEPVEVSLSFSIARADKRTIAVSFNNLSPEAFDVLESIHFRRPVKAAPEERQDLKLAV